LVRSNLNVVQKTLYGSKGYIQIEGAVALLP
jgi:hypothetical protein